MLRISLALSTLGFAFGALALFFSRT